MFVTEIKPTEIAQRHTALNLAAVFEKAVAISAIVIKMHFLKLVEDDVVLYILSKDNRRAL